MTAQYDPGAPVESGYAPVNGLQMYYEIHGQGQPLVLLAEGLHNTEIADRLSTTPKTAEHHVSAILAKLEVRSRAEAVRAAYQLGILPQPIHPTPRSLSVFEVHGLQITSIYIPHSPGGGRYWRQAYPATSG